MYVNVNGVDIVVANNENEKTFVTYGKKVEKNVYSASEITSLESEK